MALEAHNASREKLEGYKKLTLDTDMAKVIQKLLEKDGFTGKIPENDRGIYTKCGENVFTLTDESKLSKVYLSNIATKTWYQGRKYYDFTAGKPKSDNTDD